MALQDLTPQLRTRLSRVERVVGLFVTVATVLLVVGFLYYLLHTAERKGWFKTKVLYSTSLNNAAGLRAGDPVKLMGFNVGEIISVQPNEPGSWYGVTVYFRIQEPNYGYIWLDSKVRVAPADFLGNRSLEIVKGVNGHPTVLTEGKEVRGVLNNEVVSQKFQELVARILKENVGYTKHSAQIDATNELHQLILDQQAAYYTNLAGAKAYWIEPLESPALTERLETLVNAVEVALPNVLALTNQLTGTLSNANNATAELNLLLAETRPAISNITVITANISDPKGSLGEWILPTNLSAQLQTTLDSADATLKTAEKTLSTANTTIAHTDTNLTELVTSLNHSLINLANLTSNLNSQVQANTNILTEISSAIVHADEMVQGLKRHWLLRSAFKEKEKDKEKAEEPRRSRTTPQRLRSPRDTP